MLEVFTDGACSGTPGPGGWAWAVEGSFEDAGYEPSTTNQRMEMRAVIEALSFLTPRYHGLLVVTDSAYVSNCFFQKWYETWIKNGWRTSSRKPVSNQDLWEKMIPLVLEHGVGFRHVRGHSGDPMNEYVDQLCVMAKKTGAPFRSLVDNL